jgi:hypothetical protein
MMDVGDLALVGSVKSLNFYLRQGSVTGLALSQGFAQAEWATEPQYAHMLTSYGHTVMLVETITLSVNLKWLAVL